MIYKVTLNGKIYEVEVEKGEAVIQAEYDAALPTQAIEVQQPLAPVQSAPQIASVAPTVANGERNRCRQRRENRAGLCAEGRNGGYRRTACRDFVRG